MRTFAVTLALLCAPALADWTQFRGPNGSGSGGDGDPPAEWSREKNVAWVADLPGEGYSQPVVAGDSVYVTGNSGPENERLHVVCYDAATGKLRWHRQFWATGRTVLHEENRVATPTPVATADRVYALWSSNDCVCLGRDGNLIWYRGLTYDYPNVSNSLGMASSPALVAGTLVCQLETDDASFAVGLDADTGENRWKIDRPRKANWSSPTILPGEGDRDDLVLLQSAGGVAAVSPANGETVWSFDGGGSTMASVAVAGNGAVLVPTGGVTAVRPPTGGSNPERLWSQNKLNCYYVSPVAHRGKVYSINSSGVLTCGDLETGKVDWQLRLKGIHWGTPAAAGDRLYCPSKEGLMEVVDLSGEKGKLLAANEVGEPLHGPPAIAGDAVYFRTDTKLWKVAEP